MHRIVFVVAVLALAAPAFAGDGRGEINQACVATGCFAGDSPRFPVEITAPGSYLLTSNLSVPDAATAGISIGVADVSLDLAGFALQGPVVCSGEPVTSCAPSGNGFGIAATRDSRIHGGIVRGFGGIGIGSGTDTRIRDMIVTNNGSTGINLSRGASVHDSHVTFNGGSGITANSGGGFGEVAGSTIRGNAIDGITATAGLLIDSRFQNNGGIGITGSAAAGRNVVTGNAGASQVGASIDVIACNQVSGVVVCPP
jgi:hypothetical protein